MRKTRKRKRTRKKRKKRIIWRKNVRRERKDAVSSLRDSEKASAVCLALMTRKKMRMKTKTKMKTRKTRSRHTENPGWNASVPGETMKNLWMSCGLTAKRSLMSLTSFS